MSTDALVSSHYISIAMSLPIFLLNEQVALYVNGGCFMNKHYLVAFLA
jgi:hypothetical protein